MSDVNLVFTVSSVTSAITVDTTTVNVTPNTTAINMFAGYAAYPPNGATGNSQVLFNDAGLFGGNSNFTYNKTSNTLTVANLQVSNVANLGVASNLRISGGSAGQYLTSNGAGGVSFTTLSPGGSNTQLQYNNNGVFGGIPNVTFGGGNISLGNISNVKISGGTNGYVLQTDGTGNLTWTAQTGGGGGSGSPGGSNSQVQYNNAGLFGGDAGFTYNDTTNTLYSDNITVASNVVTTAILTNSILHSNGIPWNFNPYPAGTNTQVQFNDNNSFAGNSNFTFNKLSGTLTVSRFAGNGALLTSITGANVTGTVANASYSLNAGNAVNANNAITSTYAGTVTAAAQPNITSTGTLVSLDVSGNATFTGPIILQEGLEKVTTNANAASGTILFDVINQAILLKTTAASANFTLNIIGNSIVSLNNAMSINQSLTCCFINTVTSNGYIPTTIQIDGTPVTVLWPTGAPAYTTLSGTAKDVYNFNIIKTAANTYTVLGSSGRFK